MINITKSVLASQLNFRDLGGLAASDGRRVKPGLLYRSGDLSSLSTEDISYLEKLGLALVIDFRAQREIDKRPDKTIATVREYVHIGIFDAARDRAEYYLAENDAAGMADVLVHDYRRLVSDHQEDFRRFLHILATTTCLPAVYHCAAGKDRTGLATVFLLAALGVDPEAIRADYLLTNEYTLPYTNRIIEKVTASGQNGAILRPLFEVRDNYLDAALGEITAIYGGLEKFVVEILMADVNALKERFLE